MAALKRWHNDFSLANNFEVLTGGVRYSVGRVTSNQNNLGRPHRWDMWSVIGWMGHLVKLVCSEEERDQCPLSNRHRQAIIDELYIRALPQHAPWITSSIERMHRHLMNFQLEFFHYCLHDSVLTIFLGIILALMIEHLR